MRGTVSRVYGGRHTMALLELDALPEDLEKYYDKDVDVEIKVHREGRSLNANAYFHVLVGKISDERTKIGDVCSKAKAKNELICQFGQPEMIDGEPMVYITKAPPEWMREQEYIHAAPIRFDGGLVHYRIYRGSHTYNTEEMSVLIDGTVAEAGELGIETMTPDQLERMKAAWRANDDKAV